MKNKLNMATLFAALLFTAVMVFAATQKTSSIENESDICPNRPGCICTE